MFCPNCGNNCGDARFCTVCGTQLKNFAKEQQPKETQKKAWIKGTPCPYCGGMQIENGKCMFCGVQLAERQFGRKEDKEVSTDIPCGVYEGMSSSLTLHDKECVVFNRTSLFRKHETRIPYDQLTEVIYARKNDGVSHLLLRWEGNKNLPVPSAGEMGKDPTTVTARQRACLLFFSTTPRREVYEVSNDVILFHIFHMLKTIAPKTAQFRTLIHPVSDAEALQRLKSKTNIAGYYDSYAPYRDQATKELCKRTGAEKTLAEELINQIFDERQGSLYSSEPTAAMRDMNLIAAEKRLREEKAAQERDEQYERNCREVLLHESEADKD